MDAARDVGRETTATPGAAGAAGPRALALLVIVALAAGVAYAGSSGGARVVGVPLFAAFAAWAFVVQWLAFVPAYLRQTERFYDLTGSLTYLGGVLGAALLAPSPGARGWLLTGLVVVWAARLGSFLFRRVHADGGDGRFDAIKPDPLRFLVAWSLQGLWVLLTAGAAVAAITAAEPAPLGPLDTLGLALWLLGFGLEVRADAEKRRFRADPANRGRFISSGVWAWSRHPNYAGEIGLWCGAALLALPALQGLALVTLISPVFVASLLIKVSGVPLLEARADARWGGQPDYEAYKARTPVLWPRPLRR